ncbi:2,5-diamino-6-ribosylamino-4(3H)-pyrimidinone 5'-phosphate reductase [Trichophyton mentagrophytes]|nr:2,5-diamino-6-ribosylamino-4(3H)-pyrimidinone 5'-phosphate reductase [Trichophyton mentagrophytes]
MEEPPHTSTEQPEATTELPQHQSHEDTEMEDESELVAEEEMDDGDSRLQADIHAQVDGDSPQAHQPPPGTGPEHPQTTGEDPSSAPPSSTSHPPANGDTAATQIQLPPVENWRPYVNPPNLGRVRQLLFEVKEPVELSLEEFTMYWPFIDNIWVKQRSTSTKDGLHVTDYYMCRLRRPTCKRPPQRPLPDGKRPRNKVVREGGTCNFQIRVVKFEGAHTTITISRSPNSSSAHSHDLDYIDKVKKNSGVMEYVRQEAAQGYLPASIFAKLREDPQQLEAAGGKHLTTIDVRNVSGKWRSNHPGLTLRPHEGYAYQNGLGVYKVQDGQHINRPPAIIAHPRAMNLPANVLPFPTFPLDFLEPYLPKIGEDHNHGNANPNNNGETKFPHVTLTYAQSMDGKISTKPGVQTVLSGPETKAMTHYLRSRHDAIIIGLGTALADDPGLNCRLEGAGGFGGFGTMWQPRPVIIDPTGRWSASAESRLLKTAAEGKGKAPWVIVSPGAELLPDKLMLLKRHGGDYLRIREYNPHWRLRWEAIFGALANQGIRSIMIEGGGVVLSELLNPEYVDFVDSVIVTVAPTYVGRNGVSASPDSKQDELGNPINALTPHTIKWQPLGKDVIMCGKIKITPPPPPPPPILLGLEAAARADES